MTELFGKIGLAVVLVLILSAPSYANNLSVTNVTLGMRNPTAHTVAVTFNLSWQNSWRNKINFDATWLTVRLATATSAVLCPMSATGLNPAGTLPGSSPNLQIYVPKDATGAFLQPSSTGFIGNILNWLNLIKLINS